MLIDAFFTAQLFPYVCLNTYLRDDVTYGQIAHFRKFDLFAKALASYVVRGDVGAMKTVIGLDDNEAQSSVKEGESYGMLHMAKMSTV